jgi:hypothetical protein
MSTRCQRPRYILGITNKSDISESMSFTMIKYALYVFALSLIGAPIADAQSSSGCASLPGTVTPNVQWSQVWQAMNQTSNCTDNCHLGSNASGQLDLSLSNISIYFLVGQDSSQSQTVKRVEAGNAKASLLFQKINCASPSVGGRMPPGGSVSPALQALIYDWIERGAYGENPDDPATRDFIFKDGTESQRR